MEKQENFDDPLKISRHDFFIAPGEHSLSLFQEENIPWSICVLLTSP